MVDPRVFLTSFAHRLIKICLPPPTILSMTSTQEPTYGTMYNYYNLAGGGVITSDYVFSPGFMVTEKYKAAGTNPPTNWERLLPDVTRWSDMTGIIWNYISQPRAGELKYIFKHNIVTPLTKQIMALAVGADIDTEDLPVWPGKTFRLGDTAFTALLGTAHGKGVVRLLAQHPNEMPDKSIDSITVFSTPVSFDFQLLFTLTG